MIACPKSSRAIFFSLVASRYLVRKECAGAEAVQPKGGNKLLKNAGLIQKDREDDVHDDLKVPLADIIWILTTLVLSGIHMAQFTKIRLLLDFRNFCNSEAFLSFLHLFEP